MVREKTYRAYYFSNDVVETSGTLKTLVKCNDCKNPKAKITLVDDGLRPIIGRDLFDQLRITISQKLCPKTEVNAIEILCVLKQSKTKEFPDLITQIGN